MTLTEAQVVESLSKVTSIPGGFFRCTLNKSRGAMTALQFWCEQDSDEYTVLVSAKDEYIEMKSGYHSWPAVIIKAILSAPVGVTPVLTPQVGGVVTSVMPLQIAPVLNVPYMITFLIDYIKLNPGCIVQTFDHADQPNIDESTTHNPAAWELDIIEGAGGQACEVRFAASNATDQKIANETFAILEVDNTTGSISSITFAMQ